MSDGASFTDRFGDIDPSPTQVTQQRIELMRDEVTRYATVNRKLPPELRDVLDLPFTDEHLRPQERWLLDGWNRPIEYTVETDGRRYELRSHGADGISGTSDDRVLRGIIV